MSNSHKYSISGILHGKSRILLITGFGGILLLYLSLVGVGLSFMYASQLRFTDIVEKHNVKTALLNDMYTSARERSLLLHTMMDLNDPFARDELFLEFNKHGGLFARSRIALTEMELSDKEIMLLEEQGQLTGKAVPIQNRIVDLVQADNIPAARRILIDEAVPAQNRVLFKLLAMQEYQENMAKAIARQSDQELKSAFIMTASLGSVAILLSMLIAFFVIRRTTNTEKELQIEKQLAEITLHSIGEAVITTDKYSNVVSINPVAEQLTGWTFAAAKGHKLESIFTLFEEGSQRKISSPIADAISTGNIMQSAYNVQLGSSQGQSCAIEYTAAPIRGNEGEIYGGILIFRDVTEVRSLAAQISYQASHDTLTGLVNRNEFELRLKQALSNARAENQDYALCYIDLDQFKVINDTCGHAAGDELLKQIASRLKTLVRESDTLARLGGDEFGVLLDGCTLAKAREIAEKILVAIRGIRFAWENKSFELGASIGVVPINALSGNLTNVMSAADTACYEAKDQGRNRLHVFDTNDINLLRRRGEMDWVHRINDAIENDKLVLYAQPIYALGSQEDTQSFELLVRMKGNNGEIIPPNAFIPAAERYNLMPAVDRYIVSKIIFILQQMRETGTKRKIFINISGQSICDKEFVENLLLQLSHPNFDPASLTFEITETATVSNFSQATRFIVELKKRGCQFALDDFGSGLSSFSYLKNIPVDYLKIDGSFIRDIADDETDYAFVRSINQIGSIMGLKTIAEFVENERILTSLKKIGVDYVQGYHFGKPVPLANILQFEQLIKDRQG